MKITNVEGIVLRLPERRAVADGTQDDLLVRIETDEGIVGYGEVDTSPEVGKAVIDAEMSHGTCYGLRDILVGMDPFDIEQIWELMYRKTNYYGRLGVVMHAMSGVDMALWDILGKAVGKPVHKLLGGSFCPDVRAYASISMPETAPEVREMVSRCRVSRRGLLCARPCAEHVRQLGGESPLPDLMGLAKQWRGRERVRKKRGAKVRADGQEPDKRRERRASGRLIAKPISLKDAKRRSGGAVSASAFSRGEDSYRDSVALTLEPVQGANAFCTS